ncbi:siderophore-interacting protein [Corynebacterium sp. Marseille-P3884]|uniref:siderophore-interacting protein n=1 Tax=Corynebacterium sp. Marseille-P3884 TaxID=2495409 RepID=UPI001B334A94|nr:siderophore-interacting protein [Corynebacterium sp. Marseille-P3884]MBP3949436.1 siderophore-interacting protein [Corynebacterium sp. Marseille-P3884]
MPKSGSLLENGAKSTLRAIYSRSMALPPERDHYPQFPARVTAVTDLTPAFRRVTIAAPEIADVTLMGPDEYVGLFMPPPAQSLQMPAYAAITPRSTLSRIPEECRPELRWYTVRQQRREDAEIDIDIVSCGHDGPGARWISRVQADDPVGVRFQTAPYGSAPDAGHHVLIADDTGLPGMLGILAAHAADADRRFSAIVEVPSEDHVLPGTREAGIIVVLRGDGAPGSALAAELGQLQLDGIDYGWVCAEAKTAALGRRFLVKERNVSRRQVMSSGFWKVGRARL